MRRKPKAYEKRRQGIAWLTLAYVLAIAGSLPVANAQEQLPTPTVQEYRLYLPKVQRPFRLFIPFFSANASLSPSAEQGQKRAESSVLLPAHAVSHSSPSLSGFVTRQGEGLQLDGKPYTFVGTNVSYLAGPFFPEDKMEEVVSFLAKVGVQVIRVWVEPWCDLERVERMLDLGHKYNVRFILTLQDFFGNEDGYWFKEKYKTRDQPHIRNIVPRFAHRPEVLMWELMNEPTCPPKDADQACWDALVHWTQVTSQEIKRLDPNHLVSVGTQRAGFDSKAIDAFRRMHALDTIDIMSIHCEAGKLPTHEYAQELAIAHELGKPIYFGEVSMRGHTGYSQTTTNDALRRRAQVIAAGIQQSRADGIDGYLLWQYAHGPIDKGNQLDYFADDPVWEVIKEATQ